jgi:hypothetical protein
MPAVKSGACLMGLRDTFIDNARLRDHDDGRIVRFKRDRPASRYARSIAPAPASAPQFQRCEEGAPTMISPGHLIPSPISRWLAQAEGDAP